MPVGPNGSSTLASSSFTFSSSSSPAKEKGFGGGGSLNSNVSEVFAGASSNYSSSNCSASLPPLQGVPGSRSAQLPEHSGTAPPNEEEEDTEPEFSIEQINECKDLFSMFDKDGGGSIDRDEFGGMMKTLGLRLTDRELDDFFFEMDKNNNAGIEFDELLTMLRKISQKLTPEQEFEEAFKFFDLDNSGSITGKEMHRVLTSMGERITMQEAEAMIRAATSGNTEVTQDTFKQFCLGANLGGHTMRRGSFSRPKGYSLLMAEEEKTNAAERASLKKNSMTGLGPNMAQQPGAGSQVRAQRF